MTAILAAYLLVLQALLGGLASGTHAGAAFAPDAYGQVICRGAMDAPAGPSDPAHHAPDCCITGCNVPVSSGTPPAAIALEVPRPVAVATLVPAQINTRHDGAPRGLHSARAPPLA